MPPEAASTGDLVEIDNLVAFQSRWFDTGEFFPPEFMHYELEVEVGGIPMTFSDDQTLFPGSLLAGEGQPIVFRDAPGNVLVQTQVEFRSRTENGVLYPIMGARTVRDDHDAVYAQQRRAGLKVRIGRQSHTPESPEA